MNKMKAEMASLDWVDICSQLSAEQRLQLKGHRLDQQVDSTNDVALQQFCRSDDLPAVCFAESQTRGRGRNGRNWVSPESQNIYMSLVWRFKLGVEKLQALSLAVGVVVADVLKAYGVDASLKWPNDVQVDGKKLAGVLLESRIKKTGEVNLVIGIGLNVSMADTDSAIIDQPWTDLARENDNAYDLDKNRIAGELLSAIMGLCNEYEKTGFKLYQHRWHEYDICTGAEIKVVEAETTHYGTCLGINDEGALKVMIDGNEKVFYAAEVSVRVND